MKALITQTHTDSEAESNRELEALRDESRAWSTEQWEAHLRTLEVELKESHSSLTEVITLGLTTNIFEFSAESYPEAAELIEPLMSVLSDRQRFVIQQLFYEGRSERRVAKAMGISRNAVCKFRKRAIKKMRSHLTPQVSTFPIVWAQVSKTCDATETADCDEDSGQEAILEFLDDADF